MKPICGVCVKRGRSFKAVLRCRMCSAWLCAGHSKLSGRMEKQERVCSNCHTHGEQMFEVAK